MDHGLNIARAHLVRQLSRYWLDFSSRKLHRPPRCSPRHDPTGIICPARARHRKEEKEKKRKEKKKKRGIVHRGANTPRYIAGERRSIENAIVRLRARLSRCTDSRDQDGACEVVTADDAHTPAHVRIARDSKRLCSPPRNYVHVYMYVCVAFQTSHGNEREEKKNAYARQPRAPDERGETDDAAESCLCSTLAPSIRRRSSFYAQRRSFVRSFVRSLARCVSCLLTYTIFVLTLPTPGLLPPPPNSQPSPVLLSTAFVGSRRGWGHRDFTAGFYNLLRGERS